MHQVISSVSNKPDVQNGGYLVKSTTTRYMIVVQSRVASEGPLRKTFGLVDMFSFFLSFLFLSFDISNQRANVQGLARSLAKWKKSTLDPFTPYL